MRAPLWIALMLSLVLAAPTNRLSADEPRGTPPPDYRIIVHPRNPLASIDRKFLADAFFKKVTRWPDETVMYPVDQRAQTSARRSFSQSVLQRTVAAVKAYWQQRIFSGRGVPPPELESDEHVVTYVLQHEGAVGYVSGSFAAEKAKIITVH